MRELTIEEEFELLENTMSKGAKYIHNGSSRVVFQLPNNRVLKVAIDRQGRTQNKNEWFLFKTQGRKHLAEIYAYGRFSLIMEQVDEYGMDYMIDVFNGEYEEDFTPEQHQELQSVIDLLEEYNGETDDNFQLGTSLIDYRLVAYDYGFSLGFERYQIVSRTLADAVDDHGPDYVLENALTKLQKLLDRNAKMCYNKV